MIIGGLDECGTGACAGPIISVMAVFNEEDKERLPRGVKDSKKTSRNQRNMLYDQLLNLAVDVGVGWAWPWEIDQGFNAALQLSYERAVHGVNPKFTPDYIIVDGINKVQSWSGKQVVEPKADNNHWQVSAASIIGKVFRDRLMVEVGNKFPEYGFSTHFGYCTQSHLDSIKNSGRLIDPFDRARYIHRGTYRTGT